MLKIKSIKIQNYRQYKDVTLNFNDAKGVFLFIGKNGVGKSNFLNAICWCLYGDEPFKHSNESVGYNSLLNTESAEESPETATIQVRIDVEDSEHTYIFQRKSRNGENSLLQVLVNDGGNYKEHNQPTILANNFLPKSIRDFFLFDGESVQKIFKGDYAPRLRKNIWRVSNIQLLDSSISHLEKTIDSLNSEINQDIPKAQEIQESLNRVKGSIIESENKVKTLEKQIDENVGHLDEMQEKLEEYSESRELQEVRNTLQKELTTLDQQDNELKNQINDLLINDFQYWLLLKELTNMKGKISKSTNAGEIPPSIRTQFIKDLLRSKVCICGNHIEENEESKLTQLLNEVRPYDERSFLLDDKYQIENILSIAKNFPNNLKLLKQKKVQLLEKTDSIQQELAEISEKLLGLESQEIGNIESTIVELKNVIKNDRDEIAITNHELTGLEEDKSEKEIELLRVQKQQVKAKEGLEVLDFLNKSKKTLQSIREKIIEQTRITVSKQTSENFLNLMWKKDQFEKVSFNDNYEVIIHKAGDGSQINLTDLSTGEIKMLGLATMKALSHVTNFGGVPVFIDGPLEYLDPEVQGNFLEMLPRYMPEKQVFIFSIDNKIITQFGETNLNRKNFFQFVFKGSSTEIKEYQEI